MCEFYETGLQCKTVKTDWKHVSSSCPRSLVVRALERYSKNPGSSHGGDACFSH